MKNTIMNKKYHIDPSDEFDFQWQYLNAKIIQKYLDIYYTDERQKRLEDIIIDSKVKCGKLCLINQETND